MSLASRKPAQIFQHRTFYFVSADPSSTWQECYESHVRRRGGRVLDAAVGHIDYLIVCTNRLSAEEERGLQRAVSEIEDWRFHITYIVKDSWLADSILSNAIQDAGLERYHFRLPGVRLAQFNLGLTPDHFRELCAAAATKED